MVSFLFFFLVFFSVNICILLWNFDWTHLVWSYRSKIDLSAIHPSRWVWFKTNDNRTEVYHVRCGVWWRICDAVGQFLLSSSWSRNHKVNRVFQQDNDSKPLAKSTQEWFRKWPVLHLDLHVVENLLVPDLDPVLVPDRIQDSGQSRLCKEEQSKKSPTL